MMMMMICPHTRHRALLLEMVHEPVSRSIK